MKKEKSLQLKKDLKILSLVEMILKYVITWHVIRSWDFAHAKRKSNDTQKL